MRDNNLVPEPKDHGCLMSEKPGIVALSFFSGALGLDLGMEAAGIEPLLYCENDRKCRMTIQAMRPHGALIGDINQYSQRRSFRWPVWNRMRRSMSCSAALLVRLLARLARDVRLTTRGAMCS